MTEGYLPFYDENLSNLYSKIIFEELVMPTFMNSEAADLIRKLLNTSPERRPSFEDIM